MDKKLPKVFANNNVVDNNKTVYYEHKDENRSELTIEKKSNLTLSQKINQIFSSSRYVYKADVIIYFKDKSITKKIIGRNKNQLITMDNELINISEVIDIEIQQ